MIAGSNGQVAWGFTNSFVDSTDLIVLGGDGESYLTPQGPRRFELHEERIALKGAEDETLEVLETIWGPVIDRDHRGRRRALAWVAHDERAAGICLHGLQTASDLVSAQHIANGCGIPTQNFVAVDLSGRIGWTLMGLLPRRVGFDGTRPGPWADGSRRWDGWLDPEEYPRVNDPPAGRIWTANNRVVGGPPLGRLGDGGYALGARARQIRDGLFELEQVNAADMLAIQLDDRALFLERWRRLVLDVLTPDALRDDPRREELKRYVEESWGGRASVDSVGYRLVHAFRGTLAERVFAPITVPCRELDPEFSLLRLGSRFEGPLWRLIQERPAHLLDPAHESWEDALLATVDALLDRFLVDEDSTLATQTWGMRNTVRFRHPLSRAAPQLADWLDIPARSLPGDGTMPRVQAAFFGASERFVVSPGREQHGFFHMPGGQSGHPLSAYYRRGHEAWAAGAPTPFLPGAPRHRLELVPSN
jgi:penicillin amidase